MFTKSTGMVWISVFITAVIVFLVFTFHVHKEVTDAKDHRYILNAKEKSVLNVLIKNDLNDFYQGKNSKLFGSGLLSVEAQQVAMDYKYNQQKANNRYYDNRLLVTGKVISINKNANNSPYLVLEGVNRFKHPQVYFDQPNLVKLEGVNSGQVATFVCIGGRSFGVVPVFRGCETTVEYANKQMPVLKRQISDFLNGIDGKYDKVSETIVDAVSLVRALPNDSNCYSDDQKCAQEIAVLMDNPNLNNQATLVEFQKVGLRFH